MVSTSVYSHSIRPSRDVKQELKTAVGLALALLIAVEQTGTGLSRRSGYPRLGGPSIVQTVNTRPEAKEAFTLRRRLQRLMLNGDERAHEA